MPIATTLPESNVVLRFPPAAAIDADEAYQLLELPAEILKRVEGASAPLPLTIKGRPNDDAVLCTPDTTFLLRTVSISNSLLVLRPPALSPDAVEASGSSPSSSTRPTFEIRDTKHEVLECVPQAANVERVRMLLRDSAWGGLGAGTGTGAGDDGVGAGGVLGKRKRETGKRYTRQMLESVIQASEKELSAGLRERNVVEVDGHMLLLPSIQLQPLLTIILTVLAVYGTPDLAADPPTSTAPTAEVLRELAEHDVTGNLAAGVLELFGSFGRSDAGGQTWTCDLQRTVKYTGLGLLEGLHGRPTPVETFERAWRAQCSESAALASLSLLAGEHLVQPGPAAASPPQLVPFPAAKLPLHPSTRFADLFLTRARWRPDDIAPFLAGLVRDGDTKERDKLVAKFVRIVKEKDGVWWYPRRSG
ncbi:Ctf8p and Ctf18p associating protein [Cryptotrichosporon argae]